MNLSPRMKRFKDYGLLGCFDDTDVTSENYKDCLDMQLNECQIRGCRNLEWKCKDCGRVASTAKFSVPGEWISIKDQSPPISFKESDNEDDEYEAHNILFYVKNKKNDEDSQVVVGWYEEEVLYPFPNLPSYVVWNGHDMHTLNEEFDEVTHWMPLPEPPSQIS